MATKNRPGGLGGRRGRGPAANPGRRGGAKGRGPLAPGKAPKVKPAPYAEADTTVTDLGGMRGKQYRGQGGSRTGQTEEIFGTGGLGNITINVSGGQGGKAAGTKGGGTRGGNRGGNKGGGRKARGVAKGSHISKRTGKIVKNKGKRGK